MKQRSDELVRFISRTFGAVTAAIVVGMGVFLALFYQRGSDEEWARHSREVSRMARDIEILSLGRESTLRGHIVFGEPISPEALGLGAPATAALLDSLRRLTAEVPSQRARADLIASAFARWDSTLQPGRVLRPGDAARLSVGRDAVTASEPVYRSIAVQVDSILVSEARRYRARIEAARRIDRVMGGSAVVALAIMLLSLFLIRRRLLAQAYDQAVSAGALDLRNAQLIDQTGQMERMIDALQASETRFRSLVDSLHDVVFTVGPDKRFTGMYGGSRPLDANGVDINVGKTAAEVLGPELGREHMDAAERALAGETLTYDWSYGPLGEMHYYETTVSPLRGRAGEIRGAVGLNREITEQVLRDKALSDARDQLRQAQRLDALGQLAGGVAHDFNNLLTVIMTYAAILQEDAPPDSDAWRSIDEIRLASERAAALTRQLLAFSRRQVLQPRAMDLNSTVRDVERMLRRLMPPDIAFETTLDPDLGTVMADPGQIEQVLVNLAINARDAMPDGGRLTISTANVDESAADGTSSTLSGPHVLVTVRDTGTGMSAETIARIFEPFFTTKGFGKGTGLGLATVHGIIEQSGGPSRASRARRGSGTSFYFRLPRLAEPLANPPADSPPVNEFRGSETILLVDDNEELRRVVKRMLARAGYRVLEAANGVGGAGDSSTAGRRSTWY